MDFPVARERRLDVGDVQETVWMRKGASAEPFALTHVKEVRIA
jgi:hypothetical protein